MSNITIDFLKEELPTSTALQRQDWAKAIVLEQFDLFSLKNLFLDDYKVSTRLSWLLTDIGIADPNYLKKFLVEFYKLKPQITFYNFDLNFIKYWHVCGIPDQQEALAMNICFDLLKSNKVNISGKRYAILGLIELYKKYPEIKTELLCCLENELQHPSKAFVVFVGKQILMIEKT
ncbi:MAG: hypothetical protein ACPGSD_08245 [Flavobacteriales bacterium]